MSTINRDITEQDRIEAAKWDLEASFYVAVIETSAEILAHLEAMDVERRFAPVPEAPKAKFMKRVARRDSIFSRRRIEDDDAQAQIDEALHERRVA